jgi:hypothetical protein
MISSPGAASATAGRRRRLVDECSAISAAEPVAQLREHALVELRQAGRGAFVFLAKSSMSARSLASSFVGVTTCTPTRRSPRVPPRRA